ncbi:MAG: hypothetical protein M0026_04390 [Nocardiopsaceae bacterium]|nr:hypothetical protein [Nocardiopsaceae bacterium]
MEVDFSPSFSGEEMRYILAASGKNPEGVEESPPERIEVDVSGFAYGDEQTPVRALDTLTATPVFVGWDGGVGTYAVTSVEFSLDPEYGADCTITRTGSPQNPISRFQVGLDSSMSTALEEAADERESKRWLLAFSGAVGLALLMFVVIPALRRSEWMRQAVAMLFGRKS